MAFKEVTKEPGEDLSSEEAEEKGFQKVSGHECQPREWPRSRRLKSVLGWSSWREPVQRSGGRRGEG